MKGCTTVFILNTWKHMESTPRVLDLSLAPRMLSSYGIYWPNFSKLVSEVTSLTHVQGKVCSFFHDLMRLGKYLVHFVQTHIGGNTFSCFATLLCCQGRHSAGCCTVGAWSSVPGMLKLTPQSLIQFDSVWFRLNHFMFWLTRHVSKRARMAQSSVGECGVGRASLHLRLGTSCLTTRS